MTKRHLLFNRKDVLLRMQQSFMEGSIQFPKASGYFSSVAGQGRNRQYLDATDRRLIARQRQRVRSANVFGGALVAFVFVVCGGVSAVVMAKCEEVKGDQGQARSSQRNAFCDNNCGR